jgi:hypothetical protein
MSRRDMIVDFEKNEAKSDCAGETKNIFTDLQSLKGKMSVCAGT